MTHAPTALGFLAPMPSELKPLQQALSLVASGKGLDAVHTGSLDDRAVVALLTGIGTARAAARARHLLASHAVDHVIVIGVAGAVVAVFFDDAGSIASRLAPAPVVPAPIADWLRAHGMEDRLEHLNIYWSEPKRLANQRQFLGFIFCRRWPANRSAIEKIERRFQSAGIASF